MSGIKDFKIVNEFGGYIHKKDQTNALNELGSYQNPQYTSSAANMYLVQGSQNVIINDADKITIRGGMALDGDSNSGGNPIVAAYDWYTNTGLEIHLRASADNGGCLQFRYVNPVTSIVSWKNLLTNVGTNINYNFSEWWDHTELRDYILFVNQTPNIFMWSGAMTTVASVTATTITKQTTDGKAVWTDARFLQTVTNVITINGVDYTYSGGAGTDTLTGVSPSPAGIVNTGDFVIQKVLTTPNKPGTATNNGIIQVFRNQVWVADLQQRNIFLSSNTDYTNYTIPSPRGPGDPFLLTLDSTPNGFAIQENTMYVAAGKNDWYSTTFTLSTLSTNFIAEDIQITKLQNGPQQTAPSQALLGKTKNKIAFVSNEPTIDELGRVELINTPQSLPLSDPIKLDVSFYDFTNGHVKYFQNKLYIAAPKQQIVLIYDYAKGFWYSPQLMAIRRFAIINGKIYGHSSITNETYELFTGANDNGNPISAVAAFAYKNYGQRARKKNFTEWYTEGYISSNTTLTLTINYDYGGANSVKNYLIDGANNKIIFTPAEDDSFGKIPFGEKPFGTSMLMPDNLSKFRTIQTMSKIDFYEVQTIYHSNDIDQYWEILACGGDTTFSTADNIEIKQ